MTEQKKNAAAALFVMLLWGALFPLVKLGYRAFSVDTASAPDMLVFAGARFLVCGFVICLFSLLRDPKDLAGVRRAPGGVLLSGVVSTTLHYGLSYVALGTVAGSKTAIIKQIGALFYICFVCLLGRKRDGTEPEPGGGYNGRRVLVGALLAFSGVFVINAEPGLGIRVGYGELLILGASFCTVFSNLISKRVFRSVEPVAATGVSQFAGGLLLLLAGLASGGRLSLLPDGRWLIFALICLFSTVSYCVWYLTVKRAEIAWLFLIKFTEPLFACVFSALLLGEPIFRWQYGAAFLLITAGVWLSNAGGRAARKGEEIRPGG